MKQWQSSRLAKRSIVSSKKETLGIMCRGCKQTENETLAMFSLGQLSKFLVCALGLVTLIKQLGAQMIQEPLCLSFTSLFLYCLLLLPNHLLPLLDVLFALSPDTLRLFPLPFQILDLLLPLLLVLGEVHEASAPLSRL